MNISSLTLLQFCTRQECFREGSMAATERLLCKKTQQVHSWIQRPVTGPLCCSLNVAPLERSGHGVVGHRAGHPAQRSSPACSRSTSNTDQASLQSAVLQGAELEAEKTLWVISTSKFNFICTPSPLEIKSVKHRFDNALISPGILKM